MNDVRTDPQRGPATPLQVFGFGGGMVAYAFHLLVGVPLVPASCSLGSSWPVHAATLLAVLVIVLSGFVAWRVLQAGRNGDLGDPALQRRRRFLGRTGLLLNGLAVLAVALADLPNHLLSPCLP